MRRHLGTTETTIQKLKQSTHERIFRRDVQILERFAKTLLALHEFTQELPALQNDLFKPPDSKVPKDIFQTLLTALLVLFDRKVKPEWGYDEIREEYKQVCGTMLNTSNLVEINARRARVALNKWRIEEAQTCNLSATKMYIWIDGVIRTVLQNIDEDQ